MLAKSICSRQACRVLQPQPQSTESVRAPYLMETSVGQMPLVVRWCSVVCSGGPHAPLGCGGAATGPDSTAPACMPTASGPGNRPVQANRAKISKRTRWAQAGRRSHLLGQAEDGVNLRDSKWGLLTLDRAHDKPRDVKERVRYLQSKQQPSQLLPQGSTRGGVVDWGSS